MEITEKQKYDLNNRNVASQSVQLGDIIEEEGGETLSYDQVEACDNDTIATQEVKLGHILKAICAGDTSHIPDLTEEQIDRLNNIDVACQNAQLGTLIQAILDGTQKFELILEYDHEMGSVSGAGRYTEGASVTIEATYNAGYKFVSWTDGEGTIISTSASYTFVMPAHGLTYTANFEALTEAYLNVGGAAYLLSSAGEDPSSFASLRFTNDSSYIEGATEICSMSEIGDNSIVAYKNGSDLIIYSPVTIKVNESGFTLTQLSGVTQIYFNNFNTDELQNATGMFLSCSALETLDLSGLTTANITSTRSMFEGCSALNRIYVSQENSDWTLYSITDDENMFTGCILLPNFDSANTGVSMAKLDSYGGYFTLEV